MQHRTNNNGSYQGAYQPKIDWSQQMQFAEENNYSNIMDLSEPEDDEEKEPSDLDISDEPILDDNEEDDFDDEDTHTMFPDYTEGESISMSRHNSEI